jgi:hypothetical protein
MKGAALAYTIYPSPGLRPRCDTDLLISKVDIERTRAVLVAQGYAETIGVTGELVSQQCMFVKHDPGGPPHVLDVHWCVVNVHRFASALTLDTLARGSVPLPDLGPAARTPGLAHALLLACLHRFAHHYETDRLIWLYDIHLLAEALSEAEWKNALRFAQDKGLAGICGRSLDAARTRLATQLPPDIAAGFDTAAQADTNEPPDRRWQLLLSDLRAQQTWRKALRLLAEQAFPAPEYMWNKYPQADHRLLPVLYAPRALSGTWKLLARLAPAASRKPVRDAGPLAAKRPAA